MGNGFVYCTNCQERKQVEKVKFLDIKEDVAGFDIMKFKCPNCGTVRESNVYTNR
jgi:uncharacterized Zn finger protein